MKPAHYNGLTAGESTCPICDRRWTVTPYADCLMPVCGCYGTDTSADNPHRPCEHCGIQHALVCPARDLAGADTGHDQVPEEPTDEQVDRILGGAGTADQTKRS